MYAKAVERVDHLIPSPTLKQDLEPIAVAIQPDRKSLFHWLRASFDAIAGYVIRQQAAAAHREVQRGKGRLSIGPDNA
jgi:hypothetical protein